MAGTHLLWCVPPSRSISQYYDTAQCTLLDGDMALAIALRRMHMEYHWQPIDMSGRLLQH